MPLITRRHALTLAASGLPLLAAPRLAFAKAETDSRFVVLFLRGAMDGLAAVPAIGDPSYEAARGGLALPGPGEAGGALALDSFFALNPLLPRLHALFAGKQALIFHATASPYRERSHFDAQNLMENGTDRPFGRSDGWLNRALAGLPGARRDDEAARGVALATRMPLLLRGAAPVTSWSPPLGAAPDPAMLARIERLYAASDKPLARAFRSARAANAIVAEALVEPEIPLPGLMAAAGRFLGDPQGPRVAMVESGGWDTHAAQALPYGALHRNFIALDAGIDALRRSLGDAWGKTAVLIVTEFGRTVAMNGTQGTDHGTASAAFLLGGAVKGGSVVADWPGLKSGDLLDGRDLRPTLDIRAIMKACLIEFLGIEARHVERVVFPDSERVKPLRDLRRLG